MTENEILTALGPLFIERNKRREIRPFDKDGKRDGCYNYLHECDVITLMKRSFELGYKTRNGNRIKLI